MAAKKRSTKTRSVGLWLGAFSLLESGRGEAAFQIIARARDAEDAARLFEERLVHLRETTSLFDAESSVYLDAIIDLSPATFPVPTLVNFVSRKESSQSDIWAPVPEQPDSRAEIYGLAEEDESEKMIEREPFIAFSKRKRPTKSKPASKSKAPSKSTKSSKRRAASTSAPPSNGGVASKRKRRGRK